jgi:hypothetical protein
MNWQSFPCCQYSLHSTAVSVLFTSLYFMTTLHVLLQVNSRHAPSPAGAHLSMRPSRIRGANKVDKSFPVTMMGIRMFIASARQTSPMLTRVGSSHIAMSVEHTIWLLTVHCVPCTQDPDSCNRKLCPLYTRSGFVQPKTLHVP